MPNHPPKSTRLAIRAVLATGVASTALFVVPAVRCQEAESPSTTTSEPEGHSDSMHDLRVRYAQARLRVAELDLERSIAANDVVRDSVGEREIQRLRNHVEMLRRQVDIARRHPRTAARHASIVAAEAAAADARADLDAAERANRRSAGSVSDLNLERLRAKADLADIRLEVCRSPDQELSLLAEFEWNLEQLTDEVIDLRHAVEAGAKHDFGKPR